MELVEISPSQLPMPLLLEADPCEEKIRGYINSCLGFAATQDGVYLGACLVLPDRNDAAEILNLAVIPSKQGQGIGTALLRWTLEQLSAKGIHRVELGTGSFGPQLTFYQRLGFRVTQVQRDYFLTHYAEPLFEQGIQHRDRLWLSLDLAE
ncbi:GNAT family N-acetyltransferase [Ferrimonas sp. YFM]|uniref:GNAT family N-acetyltransferase n=1 Tax=Ferrimonas sp. YFM TaxID=3028878 RepID=UPI002572C3C3|nr:GNAT family N-acetyltransferase [Ferrimonas sp. YFM]BDY04628.1 N-acetyltransferase [Ferrimonas sp. YFM]